MYPLYPLYRGILAGHNESIIDGLVSKAVLALQGDCLVDLDFGTTVIAKNLPASSVAVVTVTRKQNVRIHLVVTVVVV